MQVQTGLKKTIRDIRQPENGNSGNPLSALGLKEQEGKRCYQTQKSWSHAGVAGWQMQGLQRSIVTASTVRKQKGGQGRNKCSTLCLLPLSILLSVSSIGPTQPETRGQEPRPFNAQRSAFLGQRAGKRRARYS